MKLQKRMLALLLALALFCAALSGCQNGSAAQGAPDTQPAQDTQNTALSAQDTIHAAQTAQSQIETLAGGGYFEAVARRQTAYQDMAASELTLDDFEPLAAALSEAAEANSREAFHRACVEAGQMLSDMSTTATLFQLESDRDAADEALGARASAQLQAFYDATDLYEKTLCAIAEGENASMLRKEFPDWQIEYFQSYDEEASSQSLELGEQELQLERTYAQLCAQEEVPEQELAELYLEMVAVRKELAELAGTSSYADYAYRAYYSRDYTPVDAQSIWKTAKEDFAPLLEKYSDTITQTLLDGGVQTRLDCSEQAVLQALSYGASRMSPEISEAAEYLLENGLYDLSYDERKLETGYTAYLYSYDVPFIFNCPYESYVDYTDTFHEFGHFLAAFYHTSDPLFSAADFDLSELQSQGMEVMFLQFYDELFGQDAKLLRAMVLENLVYGVVMGAMYDEFQQKVYAEDVLTVDKLLEIFCAVYEDYGFAPYEGYEYEWTYVIHNFQQPFYYISYAVSAIPALGLYVHLLDDPGEAMDTYLRVASMSDEEYYLTDALREAGLANTMKAPIGDVIAQRLEESGAFALE